VVSLRWILGSLVSVIGMVVCVVMFLMVVLRLSLVSSVGCRLWVRLCSFLIVSISLVLV